MTSRTLGSRVDEHIVVSSRTGARLTCPSHSAISDHANVCDVRVDSANLSVLVSSSSTLDLRILESLHILKTKTPLNEAFLLAPIVNGSLVMSALLYFPAFRSLFPGAVDKLPMWVVGSL